MATALSAAISMSPLATAAPDPGDLTGGGVVPPIEPMTWRTYSPGTGTPDFFVADSSESIQDAIDDAEDWDIIELGSDTWVETLDFQGKAIWLIGNGRVTLRGEPYYPTAMQQEGTASDPAHLRLTNIVFSGGTGYGDQCLKIDYTELELNDCVFNNWMLDDWTSPQNGAAIEADDSNISIDQCRFDTCVAKSGGALHGYRSNITMANATFVGCAANNGGAVEARLGQFKATHSTFQYCSAKNGGALFLIGYNPHYVTQCRFNGNFAEDGGAGYGGAICHQTPGGYPLYVNDCVFTNNSADQAGAIQAVNLRVDRCNFSGNSSTSGGWDILATAYIREVARSRFCGNTPATIVVDTEGRSLIYSADDTAADVTGCWMGVSLACSGCDLDLQFDGRVGIVELLQMLEDWGQPSALQDTDGDLEIGVGDLTELLYEWGMCIGNVFDGGSVPFGGLGGTPF